MTAVPKNALRTVLVVDDDEDARRQIVQALNGAGYQVLTASTVREALSCVAESPPDLMITNPEVPRLDGFAITDWLGADPITQHVPNLYIIPRDVSGEVAADLGLQKSQYLEKPLDPDALVDQCDRILKGSKRRRQGGARPVAPPEDVGPLPSFIPREEPIQRQARQRVGIPIVLSLILGLVLPAVAYIEAPAAGLDLARPIFLVTAVALLLNAFLVTLKGFLGLGGKELPPEPVVPPAAATALVLCEMPDDVVVTADTVRSLLDINYPLQVVLVCGEPEDVLLAGDLRAVVRDNWRVQVIRVEPGTSMSEKISRGLEVAQGEIVAIFTADQRPAPDSFERAWRWLGSGYDMVRGHSVVRNRAASWVTRLEAVEAAADICSQCVEWGLYGGSNSYWRRRALEQDPRIAAVRGRSVRSVSFRAAYDRQLLATQLAPTTLRGRWRHELATARTWTWLSLRRLRWALRSHNLNAAEKLDVLDRGLWRQPYVWIAAQVFPLSAYWIWENGSRYTAWLEPVLILGVLYLLSTAPARAMCAYALATPALRRHTFSFLSYVVVGSTLLTPLDNLAGRVAQLVEITGRPSSRRHRVPHTTLPAQLTIPAAPVPEPESAPAPVQQEPEPVPEPEEPAVSIPDSAAVVARANAALESLIDPDELQGVEEMHDQYPTVDDPWTRQVPPLRIAGEEPADQPVFPAPVPSPVQTPAPAAEPAAANTNPMSAATTALQRSQEFVDLVRSLVQQVEALEGERANLSAKLESAQADLASQQSFRKALLAGPAAAVVPSDLRTLQGLVDSLVQEPYHIGVLAQIGGHAAALSSVVSGYAQMRNMLEGERGNTAE